MTAVPTLHTVTPQRADQPLAQRLIGVGVHDVLHDRATVEWPLGGAAPGRDVAPLVHAYVPLRLDGCAWAPVSTDRDRRHTAASRIVAQAVQRASEGHHALEVGGSAIGGVPDDVLIELGSVVDVLGIGDDSHDPLIGRKISTRVQDHARCPIISVPRDYFRAEDDRAITVVVDEDGLTEPVMAFAADLARRRNRTLLVSRAWSSLHEGKLAGPRWLAEQQEEMDAQLAGWRAAYPELAVAARLELGYSWLDRLRGVSSLLVTATRSADLVRSSSDSVHSCPVAVVPEPAR